MRTDNCGVGDDFMGTGINAETKPCHLLWQASFLFLESKSGGGAEGEGKNFQADSMLSQSPTWGLLPGPQDHNLS